MDTAVSLVQAYLHVNGYFTVVEHPVLESLHAGQGALIHRPPAKEPRRDPPRL